MSSAGKPLASWTAQVKNILISVLILPHCLILLNTQAAVQECREACGGHGFLGVAGLGKLRGDNDANCTYEGDNTVLLQQTSQWLLGLVRAGGKVESPMGSVAWLAQLVNNPERLKHSYWSEGRIKLEIESPRTALTALRVLVWRLLEATEQEVLN